MAVESVVESERKVRDGGVNRWKGKSSRMAIRHLKPGIHSLKPRDGKSAVE